MEPGEKIGKPESFGCLCIEKDNASCIWEAPGGVQFRTTTEKPLVRRLVMAIPGPGVHFLVKWYPQEKK